MCLNITIVRKIQFTQYVALTVKQIRHEFYTMFHPFFCTKLICLRPSWLYNTGVSVDTPVLHSPLP